MNDVQKSIVGIVSAMCAALMASPGLAEWAKIVLGAVIAALQVLRAQYSVPAASSEPQEPPK